MTLHPETAVVGVTRVSVDGLTRSDGATVTIDGVGVALDDGEPPGFVLPATIAAGSVDVIITRPRIGEDKKQLLVLAAPVTLVAIRGDSPKPGLLAGDRIVIQGIGFDARATDRNLVAIEADGESTTADVLSASDSLISATLPATVRGVGDTTGARGGTIRVRVSHAGLPETTSEPFDLVLVGAPTLLGVSPPVPIPGERVLLYFEQPLATLVGSGDIAELSLSIDGRALSDLTELPAAAYPARPGGTETIVEATIPDSLVPGPKNLKAANARREATPASLRLGRGGNLVAGGSFAPFDAPDRRLIAVRGMENLTVLVEDLPRRLTLLDTTGGKPMVRVLPGSTALSGQAKIEAVGNGREAVARVEETDQTSIVVFDAQTPVRVLQNDGSVMTRLLRAPDGSLIYASVPRDGPQWGAIEIREATSGAVLASLQPPTSPEVFSNDIVIVEGQLHTWLGLVGSTRVDLVKVDATLAVTRHFITLPLVEDYFREWRGFSVPGTPTAMDGMMAIGVDQADTNADKRQALQIVYMNAGWSTNEALPTAAMKRRFYLPRPYDVQQSKLVSTCNIGNGPIVPVFGYYSPTFVGEWSDGTPTDIRLSFAFLALLSGEEQLVWHSLQTPLSTLAAPTGMLDELTTGVFPLGPALAELKQLTPLSPAGVAVTAETSKGVEIDVLDASPGPVCPSGTMSLEKRGLGSVDRFRAVAGSDRLYGVDAKRTAFRDGNGLTQSIIRPTATQFTTVATSDLGDLGAVVHAGEAPGAGVDVELYDLSGTSRRPLWVGRLNAQLPPASDEIGAHSARLAFDPAGTGLWVGTTAGLGFFPYSPPGLASEASQIVTVAGAPGAVPVRLYPIADGASVVALFRACDAGKTHHWLVQVVSATYNLAPMTIDLGATDVCCGAPCTPPGFLHPVSLSATRDTVAVVRPTALESMTATDTIDFFAWSGTVPAALSDRRSVTIDAFTGDHCARELHAFGAELFGRVARSSTAGTSKPCNLFVDASNLGAGSSVVVWRNLSGRTPDEKQHRPALGYWSLEHQDRYTSGVYGSRLGRHVTMLNAASPTALHDTSFELYDFTGAFRFLRRVQLETAISDAAPFAGGEAFFVATQNQIGIYR